VRIANGTVTRRVFRGARIEIEGKEGEFMVLELPVDVSPLIGQVVLEKLDFHPDLQNRKLRGRPDSPDKMVVECYFIEA
jgi:predicted aspartyl protease